MSRLPRWQSLLGAEIPLRRLDRAMPQQKLDLLQVAARLPAELGAGPAEVVGSEVLDSNADLRLRVYPCNQSLITRRKFVPAP
jgi:hypothetical protein